MALSISRLPVLGRCGLVRAAWLAIGMALVLHAPAAELDVRRLLVTGPSGESLRAAADNDLHTAWLSPEPQRPGMAITVDLGVTGVVHRLYLTPGAHRSAYPRALRVLAGIHPGAMRTVLVTNLATQVDADLRFTPTPAACLRVELVGEGAAYAWAISELAVFGIMTADAWPPRDAVQLSADAPGILQQAAQDLAYALTELTSRAVPLITDARIPPSGGTCYRINIPTLHTNYLEHLGTDAFLHPERFRVNREGAEVIFSGHTARGVAYAVYEFLHRQGVRWVYPDALGDSVPGGRGVRLDLLPLEGEPAFESRYANWNTERQQTRPDEYAWYVRNRWNGSWNGALNERPGEPLPESVPHFGYTHTFETLIPAARFKSSPSWFPQFWNPAWIRRIGPLNLGRRIPYETTWGLNFCTSNPEVIDHISRRIRSRTRPPQAHAISWLVPMDAGSFCECAGCRPLDKPHQPAPPYWDVPRALSNRYFTFIDAVAQRTRREAPNVRIGAFAYEGYLPPPIRFPRLASNVVVDVVQYGAYNLPLTAATNATMRAYLEGWATRWTEPGHLGIYDWALLTGGVNGCPVPLVTALAERIGTFHRLGARRLGTQADNTHDVWRYNPWNFYAYSRLAWDPEEPVDVILGDFFSAYYRESAAPMQDYYHAWEQYLLTNAIALGEDCRYRMPTRLPATLLSSMSRHLATARNSAEHWLVRQRVADATEGFRRLAANVTATPEP